MLRATIAIAATTVLLAACSNSEGEVPIEGPAVSSAEAPMNPAIDTRDTTRQDSLTPGANSFTEGQAREAMEKQGYAISGPLTQGENGIWTAQASLAGAPATTVSVDYKGVVSAG